MPFRSTPGGVGGVLETQSCPSQKTGGHTTISSLIGNKRRLKVPVRYRSRAGGAAGIGIDEARKAGVK